LSSFPVVKCEAHKSKLLDMYCADHDDVACATCIAIKHRFDSLIIVFNLIEIKKFRQLHFSINEHSPETELKTIHIFVIIIFQTCRKDKST
jgi:hypothetical protein